MATKSEIIKFLSNFRLKMGIWDVVFINRNKNIQTLASLEITPNQRKDILGALVFLDYSEGPLEDRMIGGADMWIFGKLVKEQEVYIKITLGRPSLSVICISFHIAEYPMKYPLKK